MTYRGHYEQDNMKATVVPNRNAMFSSRLYGTALSIATANKTDVEVVLGVHSGDHAIYPDVARNFTRRSSTRLHRKLGQRAHFIPLPYLEMDKAGS